jgi:uncharacterized membrane protein YqaE (UPF0057 family)
MKMKNLLLLLVLLLASQTFFSCSSGEHFRFTGINPEAQNKVKAKIAPAADLTAPEVNTSINARLAEVEPAPVLEAQVATSPVIAGTKAAPVASLAPRLAPTRAPAAIVTTQELAQAREKLASLSKAEKKALKKDLRQIIGNGLQADSSMVLLIILAILIPPLAVGLKEGIGSRFWISLLLTLLFFLPGVIYALLVVTDTI